MSLDMRALYYIVLQNAANDSTQREEEDTKANENCLNQNFIILAQKLTELDERLTLLEG
jgi:hypothetical protein